MNEENTQPQTEQPSVGQLLKNHREDANISIAAIAASLRLTPIQIQYLENDDYKALGSKTFIKGYIKNYCRELKISSTALLEMLPELTTSEKSVDMQSFSRRTEHEANDSRLMVVSYLIIAIIIGASAVWWWQNSTTIAELTTIVDETSALVSQKNTDDDTNNDNAETDTNNNNTAADAEVTHNDELTQTTDTTLNELTTPSSVEIEVETEVETRAIAPPVTVTATDPNASTIVMMFNDDSWVEIHDANEERIAFGVKKAGYKMTLSGIAPFSVVLGKHNVVNITLNGDPVNISAFPRNRLAKFKLPLAE